MRPIVFLLSRWQNSWKMGLEPAAEELGEVRAESPSSGQRERRRESPARAPRGQEVQSQHHPSA